MPQDPISVICVKRTLSNQEQAKKQKKERHKTISFWVRIASLAVLVIYASFTILIWRANQKAAEAAKSAADTAAVTMHLDEKAWLVFDPDHSDTLEVRDPKEIAVPIQLRDIGKTPAIKIDGFVVVEELKAGDAPIFREKPHNIIKAELIWPNFPSNTYANEFTSEGQTIAMTSEKLRQHNHGDFVFAVWGRINYEDVFEKPHWVQFCHTISPRPSDHSTQCADYNQIDSAEK